MKKLDEKINIKKGEKMSKYVTTFTIPFIVGCIAAGSITGFSEMGRYFFFRIIAILFFVYAPIAIAFCLKAKDDTEYFESLKYVIREELSRLKHNDR